MMDWDDLRYFLEVARTGSLSAASRKLQISQATIGRRIQSLEASLGVSLFERLNTGYVLSSVGQEVVVQAEAAELAVLKVARCADGTQHSLQGTVRLATSENLAGYVVAPGVPSFHKRFPTLQLQLMTEYRTASLSRREADLALRIIRPDQGDLVRRRAGTIGFGLYAAPALIQRNPQIAHDPWTADLVGWNESSRDLPLARWLHGKARGLVVTTAASTSVQLALAKSGIGASLLPCFMADGDSDLVRLIGPADVISFDLWLVAHRDLSKTPRVRAALDFMADLCEQEGGRLRGE